MNVIDAVTSRRTIRKFQRTQVKRELLVKYINAARLSPQGANRQPVKYIIIDDKKLSKDIYSFTKWAGYFNGEYSSQDVRPASYIALLVDKNISKSGFDTDVGIIGGAISLMAHEDNLGCCWLGAIDKENICKLLNIKDDYHLHSLLAFGYPKENPKAVDMIGEDCKYYLDKDTLTVPKRKIDDILFINKLNGGL